MNLLQTKVESHGSTFEPLHSLDHTLASPVTSILIIFRVLEVITIIICIPGGWDDLKGDATGLGCRIERQAVTTLSSSSPSSSSSSTLSPSSSSSHTLIPQSPSLATVPYKGRRHWSGLLNRKASPPNVTAGSDNIVMIIIVIIVIITIFFAVLLLLLSIIIMSKRRQICIILVCCLFNRPICSSCRYPCYNSPWKLHHYHRHHLQ